MQTLWHSQTSLHPTFALVNNSLVQDWFLLPFELDLQRAHAHALLAAGVLSQQEYAAIESALDRILTDHAGGPCPASDAEDLHTWIEGVLVELAGDAGRKIHTARSRNDQVATLLKQYVIFAGKRLSEDLVDLVRVACRRAKGWADLIFAVQTHTQFAAPGSVGFWMLRYCTALDRGRRHLDWCVTHWSRWCPLGSGAVAGSSIPIDRGIQAGDLGFGQPSLNALDSTSTRDECLDLLAVASQVALHLQSLATDVIAFAQTPFGWVKYPAAFGTGSSMMPNKHNPDAMELLRGECCAVAAAHGQALLLLKGLPSGYNRDLQCIKPLVRDAADKLTSHLEMATAFLGELEFDAVALKRSLRLGEIDATLRMERKVADGVPLRDAHQEVARELAQRGGGAPSEPAISAAAYQTVGSASPAETRRIADELLAGLES